MTKKYAKSPRRAGRTAVVVQERRTSRAEEVTEIERLWDSLRLYEARVIGQQTKSSAWDESEALGIPAQSRRTNQLSEREYKDTLCKAYINMPWISSCIDARVLRLVSGTWELVPTCEDADEAVRDQILELLLYVNDDEDLLQLLYSYALDIMIYGEGYIEIVRGGKGKPADMPTSLHKVDCQTMTYRLDDRGNIQGYEQQLTHTPKPIPLGPDQIMRCWFPHPESNKKSMSPIAKLIGAAMLYEQMMDWARKFFKKGARPPFSFKHPGDKRKAEEFLLWLKENFTGAQNAHVPLLTYDGVETQYAPAGPIDLDFLKGLEWVRQEVMSNLQTPPANIAVIESGNLGGGTGDSQQKTFMNNAVKPLDRLIMEKFNFTIIKKGFKTNQWKLVLHPASYADDGVTSEIQDRKIRNGTLTINEARKENGNAEYEDGVGDTPIFSTTKDIVPVPRLNDMEEEQRQSAQLDLQTKQADADLAQTKVEQAKKPPAPPPTQQGETPDDDTQPKANTQSGGDDAKGVADRPDAAESRLATGPLRPAHWPERRTQASSSTENEGSGIAETHTGIMVAFMLDDTTARRLALPDGEPAGDMHITLAYIPTFIGDTAMLKTALTTFAADTAPLEGRVSGVGRFTPSDSSDGLAPIIALVDAKGLHHLHDTLVQFLTFMGVPVADNFAYTPHITLTYVDADASMPVTTVPDVPLSLQSLCLAVGDERTFFPLGGKPTQESGATTTTSPAIWEPPDTDARLEALAKDGVVELEWEGDAMMCGEMCLPNDGKRVKLGEAFPSGHRMEPAHPHCGCATRKIKRGEK